MSINDPPKRRYVIALLTKLDDPLRRVHYVQACPGVTGGKVQAFL
jgi:hypothetical protein